MMLRRCSSIPVIFELLSKKKVVFDLPFLFEIHKYFLGILYPWQASSLSGYLKIEYLFAPVSYITFHQRP